MSTSQSSQVTQFRDSVKVLRDLTDLLNSPEALVLPKRGDDTVSSASGRTAIDILNHIREVIDNAPTSTRIHKKTQA